MKMMSVVSFLCGLLMMSGLANAAIIPLNSDPLALAGCSGLASVSLTKGSHTSNYDVAYAVYDAAVYNADGRFDPSHNQDKYIYAYQIFNSVNSSRDMKLFSIALSGSVPVDNITYDKAVGVPSGVIPHVEGENHYSATWLFSSDSIGPGEHSVVLLFTSNSVPGGTKFSIGNNGGISGIIAAAPSPIPEPTTLVLLGLGTILLKKKE